MRIAANDGRAISLEYLEQRRTYAGVLCGRFSAADHDRRIADFLAEARERMPWLGEIHVIAPVRAKLPHKPDSPVPDAERLPPVMSIGQFHAGWPVRDESEMFSWAAFLWFQDEFGLPDERAVEEIGKVNWKEVASDWSP